MKIVRKFNRIPIIKGAFLASIYLLTYKPVVPAANTL